MVKTLNIGNGRIADLITLNNGQVIGISDDWACLYPSEACFLNPDDNNKLIDCITLPDKPFNKRFLTSQNYRAFVSYICRSAIKNQLEIVLFNDLVLVVDPDFVYLYNSPAEASLNDYELAIESISRIE